MEEWIKKSDAIEAIKSLVIIHTESRYLNDLEYGHNDGLAHAIDRIEDIPSADTTECTCCEYRVGDECCYSDVDIKADRPKGEWRNLDGEPVPLDEGGCPTESAWCSECGTWLVASDEHSVIGRYCPNCGADMRGER